MGASQVGASRALRVLPGYSQGFPEPGWLPHFPAELALCSVRTRSHPQPSTYGLPLASFLCGLRAIVLALWGWLLSCPEPSVPHAHLWLLMTRPATLRTSHWPCPTRPFPPHPSGSTCHPPNPIFQVFSPAPFNPQQAPACSPAPQPFPRSVLLLDPFLSLINITFPFAICFFLLKYRLWGLHFQQFSIQRSGS